MITEQMAIDGARDLVERLGDGWRASVKTNGLGGWYYEANRGNSTVTANVNHRGTTKSALKIDGYTAWIEPDCLMGRTCVQFIEHASDPNDAVGFAVQAARGVVLKIQAELDAISGVTP